jgi:hypothetical protein
MVSAFTAYSMCPSVAIELGRIKLSFAALCNVWIQGLESMVSRVFQTGPLGKSDSPLGKCRGRDTTMRAINNLHVQILDVMRAQDEARASTASNGAKHPAAAILLSKCFIVAGNPVESII